MAWLFNPFTGSLDYYSKLTNPLQFQGDISASGDFPASPSTGDFYTVSASVTDPYHSGQSFVSGDEIAFNGTEWVLLGNTLNFVPYTGATANVDLGTRTLTTTGDLTVDTNVLKVDTTNDRVGIGTATPSEKLHIVAEATDDGLFIDSGALTGVSRIVDLYTNSDSALRVASGTGTYATQFLVVGDSFASNPSRITFRYGGYTTFEYTDGSSFSEKVRFTSTGRVGIGTTTPTEALDVVGNINASGTITGSNLSGTNTGDQTSSDFDHNALTNYVANEHIDWTDSTEELKTTNAIKCEGVTVNEVVKSNMGFDIRPVVRPDEVVVTPIAGAGLEVGDYTWQIQYLTALGETVTRYSSRITTTAGNQQAEITLPISTDPRVTGRRIYRTLVNESTYVNRLVTTINDNTTATYIDSTPDASLPGSSSKHVQPNTTTRFVTIDGTGAMMLDSQLTCFGFGSINYSTPPGGRTVHIGGMAGGASTGGEAINIGHYAGYHGGGSGVRIGNYAGFNNTASRVVAIGGHAAYNSASAFTSYGVYIGGYTGERYTAGNYCTFVGGKAGSMSYTSQVLSDNSTALGYEAYTDTSNQMVFGNASVTTNIFNGKVGVGTRTPNAKLDVVGGVRLGDSTTNYAEFKDDGEVNLFGTARVKRDIWINAEGFQSPGTKPATRVDYGIGDAWEFTKATDDTLYGRVKLPEDMDKSAGLTFFIGWATDVADAGNARWQVEYLFRQVDEAMDAAADATLVDNFASSSTAKGLVLSEIGSTAVPHANEVCLTFRIKRRGDEVDDDTIDDDVHLFGLCLTYTSNKLGAST